MRVEIDQAQLTEVKVLLAGVKNGAPKVLSRSINKTLTGTNSTAKKEIAKHYNLTQKKIGENIKIYKAAWTRLSGKLESKGKPLSLTSFRSTRQTAKGVSVLILVGTKRSIVKHAFLRTAKGSKQAFWRKDKPVQTAPFRKTFPYARLPKKYRYPIVRLTGPRVEDEFAKPRTLNVVETYAGDRFEVVVDQELNYELSKL